jgi:hypothetical protein
MATVCNACHVSGSYSNPFLGASAGTANNPGIGCNGCHGEYYGPTLGYKGAGLRQHHAINNVPVCGGCHTDDPVPMPESVNPEYYGSVDTRADDSCNTAPNYKENWSIGDHEGQDNDGDNFYDTADPDCQAAGPGDLNCDGVIDFADINPFVLALSDPFNFEVTYPGCNIRHGDCNNDGSVDFNDINAFVALLSGA